MGRTSISRGLCSFALHADLDGVRFALQLGADPNYPNDGRPPLAEAAHRPDFAVIKELIKAGAKAAPAAFATAAFYRDPRVIHRFFDAGADPKDALWAVEAAARNRDTACLRALAGRRVERSFVTGLRWPED